MQEARTHAFGAGHEFGSHLLQTADADAFVYVHMLDPTMHEGITHADPSGHAACNSDGFNGA